MSDTSAMSGQRLVTTALVFLLTATTVLADEFHADPDHPEGARVFLTFCAGCHGVDGFAAYSAAPSFSMGDRLDKSDDSLLQSMLEGMGAMPPWENKLSEPELRSAIRYLRDMNERRQLGLSPREQSLPGTWYRFRPLGEQAPVWWREEHGR